MEKKDSLKVLALGGLREVGANCYLFETTDHIVIIDCGIKLISNSNLVSGIIPNFSYLWEKKHKIRGLVLTHGHDDHIAAIPYLDKLIPGIPIYGSNFTISLIKQKFRETSLTSTTIFDDNSLISLGDFRFEFFRVTHSIPDSYGILLKVFSYRIVITGDFKFDWNSIGEYFDIHKLAEYSKKGVDLLLSECTNADREGNTPSESRVIKRLETIISEANSRVIITSFASNVYRLKKVIEIAKKTGRKIILLGTSLIKYMKAIQKASLWKIDGSVFLKAKDISSTPHHQTIIFCTGSQGEDKAVLGRLARQTYIDFKIEKGDTIILTSSPIVDNKTEVELNNNKLFSLGAKVYENSPEDILHSSGHAYKEDLRLLLRIVQPRYLMPVHGDEYMLRALGYLAQEAGILKDNIFICRNGDTIIGENGFFFLGQEKIDTTPDYFLEGKLLPKQELQDNLLLRKKMLQGGVMIVIFAKESELPFIFTCGFLNMQKSKNLVDGWKRKLKIHFEELEKKQTVQALLKTEICSYINNVLLSEWRKEKPFIQIITK